MITLTGEIIKTFYNEGGYSIRKFQSEDIIKFPDGNIGRTVNIKGLFIPDSHVLLKIIGDFDLKPFKGKNGESYTFVVESTEEVKIKERNAIIRYLKTLKGVGNITAIQIYNTFGEETYDVLDKDINNLKKVKSIGKKKFEVISKDYLSRGAAKELYTYLYKYGVKNNKANVIFTEYQEKSVEMVKTHPHSFYIKRLLSFNAAEKITRDEGLDLLSEERIEACCNEALFRAEGTGNTFLRWGELLANVLKLLDIKESREVVIQIAQKVRSTVKQMGYGIITNKQAVNSGDPIFYLKKTGEAEFGTADAIMQLLGKKINKRDYMDDIKKAEEELSVSLSEEQENAVQTVLNSPLSVVTGGPGTGKTTFQQVLFKVYQKYNSENVITLGAPTGRAARRMTESSGLPARTLHSILGLTASDEGDMITREVEEIPEGLIVVDEVSMMDIFLSQKLFEAVPEKAQIVCIGDIYQLPSVGPGTVLKSMIDSKIIPTVTFTKIFRQKEGSCIAENAGKINKGEKTLQYDEAFSFIEEKNPEGIVEEVKRLYKTAVDEYGIDEVIVLTPYRRNTLTGVNQLNPVLKELVNPIPATVSKTNKIDGTNIYLGDRVMFTKNMDELTNGDTGYVTNIQYKDKMQIVTIDFMDGRVVNLAGDELNHLVLAYCTTIHKSQGSEYQCCIIIIDKEHEILLKRNLVYTAITRSKQKVFLVGSREAFLKSIDMEDTTKRNSQLADLLATA